MKGSRNLASESIGSLKAQNAKQPSQKGKAERKLKKPLQQEGLYLRALDINTFSFNSMNKLGTGSRKNWFGLRRQKVLAVVSYFYFSVLALPPLIFTENSS